MDNQRDKMEDWSYGEKESVWVNNFQAKESKEKLGRKRERNNDRQME